MKKFSIFYLGVLFTLSCLTIGCSKFDDINTDNIDYQAEFAIPLVNSKTSINDIIGELDSTTTIELDDDGLIHFIYRGDFTEQTSADLFFSLPLYFEVIPDTFHQFALDIATGYLVDYVTLRSGTINCSYVHDHDKDVTVFVEFPEVTDPVTGETLKSTYVVPHDGGNEVTGIEVLDLTGWNLTPEDPDDDIHMRYLPVDSDGEIVFGPGYPTHQMRATFVDLNAKYIQGYLGQTTYELPRDTILIDFFEQWIGGGVNFADPSITITVENAFGLPVVSKTNALDLFMIDGSVKSLESAVLEEGVYFDYPTLEEVGEIKRTVFRIDQTNSNIKDLFLEKPVAVDYEFEALTNPDEDTEIIGWATDSSFFNVNVFVDLPAYGNADLFTIRTEFSTELSEFDYADYAILKVVTENNIPIDAAVQLYFKKDGNVLDSLLDLNRSQLMTEKRIIEAAGTDANGFSNSTTYNVTEYEITEDKLDALIQADSIQLISIFDNEPGKSVRFQGSNDCTVKIGMRVGISE